jgi:hypothetical protein
VECAIVVGQYIVANLIKIDVKLTFESVVVKERTLSLPSEVYHSTSCNKLVEKNIPPLSPPHPMEDEQPLEYFCAESSS